MKRYDKIHIISYKKIFLLEGKKQALQMLEKYFDKRDAKKFVESLEELDPTAPKNKYIELFAKLFISLYKDSSTTRGAMTNFRARFQDDQIKEKIAELEKKNQKIDVSRIKDFDEFVNTVNRLSSKITKSSAKKGMSGLKEGKDYLTVLKNKEVEAYIPLHYKASKVIASDRVGYCEGEWCTAYQKTDGYWQDYVVRNGVILVYVIVVDPDVDKYDSTELKTAIAFYNSPSTYEIFDAKDDSIKTTPQFNKIQNYISKNWEEIKSKFPGPLAWLNAASTYKANYSIINNDLVWDSGTWKNGVWEDGYWMNGDWLNGEWKTGVWSEGTWRAGVWSGGVWEDGLWYDGIWEGGEWENGVWADGTWEDGTWEGGEWEGGKWKNGRWLNGIWKGGIWEDGIWEGGTWVVGIWNNGKIYDPETDYYEPSAISPKEYFENKKGL